MTGHYFEALADGFKHQGTDRDEVVGRAGDHWSMQKHEWPVKVYLLEGGVRTLIWQDGQPWPRAPHRGHGRMKR
jgi:hypothetical protein